MRLTTILGLGVLVGFVLFGGLFSGFWWGFFGGREEGVCSVRQHGVFLMELEISCHLFLYFYLSYCPDASFPVNGQKLAF